MAWQRRLEHANGLTDMIPDQVRQAYDTLKGAKVDTYNVVLTACENCQRVRLASREELEALQNLCEDAGIQVFQDYANPLSVQMRYPGQQPPTRAPQIALPSVVLTPSYSERALATLWNLISLGPVRSGPLLLRCLAIVLYVGLPVSTAYWGVEQMKAVVSALRARALHQERISLQEEAIVARNRIDALRNDERRFADRFQVVTGTTLASCNDSNLPKPLVDVLLKHKLVREAWTELMHSQQTFGGLDAVEAAVANVQAGELLPSHGRAVVSSSIEAVEIRFHVLSSMQRNLDLLQLAIDAARFDHGHSFLTGALTCDSRSSY